MANDTQSWQQNNCPGYGTIAKRFMFVSFRLCVVVWLNRMYISLLSPTTISTILSFFNSFTALCQVRWTKNKKHGTLQKSVSTKLFRSLCTLNGMRLSKSMPTVYDNLISFNLFSLHRCYSNQEYCPENSGPTKTKIIMIAHISSNIQSIFTWPRFLNNNISWFNSFVTKKKAISKWRRKKNNYCMSCNLLD